MSDLASKPDDDLVALGAAGNREALELLYDRYRSPVLGYATRITRDPGLAEDVFQNTFAYVFEHLDRYEARGRFAAYLFRIARSFATNEAVATRKAREPLPPGRYFTPESGAADEAAERERRVREAVDRLSPALREVVELRLYQGLEYGAVAEVAGISEATARSRLRYALEALREAMGVPGRESSADFTAHQGG